MYQTDSISQTDSYIFGKHPRTLIVVLLSTHNKLQIPSQITRTFTQTDTTVFQQQFRMKTSFLNTMLGKPITSSLLSPPVTSSHTILAQLALQWRFISERPSFTSFAPTRYSYDHYPPKPNTNSIANNTLLKSNSSTKTPALKTIRTILLSIL